MVPERICQIVLRSLTAGVFTLEHPENKAATPPNKTFRRLGLLDRNVDELNWCMVKKLHKSKLVKKAFRLMVWCGFAIIFGMNLAIQNLSAQGLPKNVNSALMEKVLDSGMSPDEIQKLLKSQDGIGGKGGQRSPLDEAREGAREGEIEFDLSTQDLPKRLSAIEEYIRKISTQDLPKRLSAIEKYFIRKIWGDAENPLDIDLSPDILNAVSPEITQEHTLRQFGYENFRKAEIVSRDRYARPKSEDAPITGAISESYVLGIGDELVVTFLGREEEAITVRIDREGQLILPKLPPISAAGRTFGDLRHDLESRVSSILVGTQVFVSLGAVRNISVYVVGEVEKPGLHRLTSMSTIMDALVVAGGIQKTGSLRRIEITRGDKRFLLDTYDLLIGGGPNYDLSLVDGDRIFVPTVSATVAVAGDSKRPAIYELPYGRSEISVAELLHLSGGTIVPRGNRILLVSIDAVGRDITQEPTELSHAMIRGGEYIHIISATGLAGGVIEVQGHVNNAGSRSLSQVPTIGALFQRNEIFKTDPYLYFAALQRTEPRTLMTTLIPVNLRPILDGEHDIGLQNRDILTVFGIDDIRYLVSSEVQKIIRGRANFPTSEDGGGRVVGSCNAVVHLASVLDGERADRFVRAKYFSRRFGELSGNLVGAVETEGGVQCPVVFSQSPELLAFLIEHSTILTGEVRRPGVYPLIDGTRLSGLFLAAGGLTVEADVKEIELTHAISKNGPSELRRNLSTADIDGASTKIGPGDIIRVNAVKSSQDIGPILVEGEVLRPGIYNIQRGERLSEIIQRAGGLTTQAFPKGAVFTRQAAREEEQRSFKRLADQLQLSLASNLLAISGQQGDNVGEVSVAAQQLVDQLREATPVGRVVIEADPTVLEVEPSLDTILQPGDRLIVPKRPNWISVSGAVLNPGTVQFTPGSDPKKYIGMVGGFSDAADKKRVFVVYPDGRAQPVRTSFWNFQSVQLIPGSSVVVPMDSTPIRFMPIAREVTSILSQLSIAGASLAVINRN